MYNQATLTFERIFIISIRNNITIITEIKLLGYGFVKKIDQLIWHICLDRARVEICEENWSQLWMENACIPIINHYTYYGYDKLVLKFLRLKVVAG